MALVFEFDEKPKTAKAPPKLSERPKKKEGEAEKPKVTTKPAGLPPKKKWTPQIDDSAFDPSMIADPFAPKAAVVNDPDAPVGGRDPSSAADPFKSSNAMQNDPVNPFGGSGKSMKNDPGDFDMNANPFGGSGESMKNDPGDFDMNANPFGGSGKSMKNDDEPAPATKSIPKNDPLPDESGEAAAPKADGPIEQRLVDKNWKTRSDAYEDLKKEFDAAAPGAECFGKYSSFLGKMIDDGNAPALDKALEAITSFVDHVGNVQPYAELIASGLLKKAFPGRPGTKDKAVTLELLLVETGAAEQVIAALVGGCGDKQWKVALAAAETLTQGLHEFGPRVMAINVVQKAITTLLDNTNPQTRKAGMDMGCEIYRWMGDLFKQQVASMGLKSAQEKEFDSLFSKVETGKARPTRFVRGSGPPQAGGGGGGAGGAAAAEEAFDPLSLVEAVDIAAKLPGDWFQRVESQAWKDRKDALDELVTLAENTPKIKVGPTMGDVVSVLKKLTIDGNVNVQAQAVKAIGMLVKGARKDFAQHARTVLGPLLVLLKEKKVTVSKPTNEALDLLYEHCLRLGDMVSPLEEPFMDKVPQTRQGGSAFLLRCLKSDKSSTADGGAKKGATEIGMLLLKILADADATVRKNAGDCLTELISCVGAPALKDVLAKFEAMDAKRCKQVVQAATANDRSLGPSTSGSSSSSSSSAAPAEEAPVAAARAPARSNPPKPVKKDDDDDGASGGGPPASLAARLQQKAPVKKPPTSSASASAAGKGGKDVKEEAFVPEPGMAFEEAKAKLAEIIDPNNIELLASKKWKEALEAITACNDKVKEMGPAAVPYTRAFFYVLDKTPSWKPVNFQVGQGVFVLAETLTKLNDETTFSKTLAYLPLEDIASKALGDKKLEEEASNCLFAFAEAVGPKWVVSQIANISKDLKNVKALEGLVLWVARCLKEFGLACVNAQQIIHINKGWLDNSNKGVRDAAVEVFVAIYRESGPVLKDMMLADLKPALASVIEAAFAQVPASEVGKATAVRAVKGTDGPAETVSMDALVPRTDISAKVNEKLLAQLGDANWKNRQDAMEEIEGILAAANHRIAKNDGGIMSALKDRLDDKNKNLVVKALSLVMVMAQDMGKEIAKHSGSVLPGIFTCMGDSKKNIVDQAVQTADVWAEVAGVKEMLPYMPKALKNTGTREPLLTVMKKRIDPQDKKANFAELIPVVVDCLKDKAAPVRKLAEDVLEAIATAVGVKEIMKATSGLNQATQLTLAPVMERLKQAGDKGAAGPAAPADEEEKKPKATEAPKKAVGAGPVATSAGAKKPVVAAPAAAGAKKKKDEEEDSDLTIKSDPKAKEKRRLREEKRSKGQFREWSNMEIDELKTELGAFLPPVMLANLFHPDFPKQISALDQLETQFEAQWDAILGILDLLLKWLGWKSCDGNTTLLLRVMAFIESLLDQLILNGYELTDGEVSVFAPFLIEKVFGHNKQNFRDSTRQVLEKCCQIYPPSKVCAVCLAGFQSKNKRVVSECCEQIGLLVEKYGDLNIIDAKKLLPEIGQMVGDADKGVRSGALNTLQRVYELIGDALIPLLGKRVPDKAMAMVNERLKRSKVKGPGAGPGASGGMGPPSPSAAALAKKAGAAPASAIKPGATLPRTPSGKAPVKGAGLVEKRPDELVVPSGPLDMSAFSLDVDSILSGTHGSIGAPSANEPDSLAIPFGKGTSSGPAGFTSAPQGSTIDPSIYRDLDSIVEEDRIEAMKRLLIKVAADGPTALQADADAIAGLLSNQLRVAFSTEEIHQRLVKYCLNSLVEIAKDPLLAATLHLSTLDKLHGELLNALLDSRLRATEEGKAVVKAVNMLTIKLLETAEPTASFHVLLSHISSRLDAGAEQNGPYLDVLIKCFLKLTKALAGGGGNVKLDVLLGDFHRFLTHHPPASFEGRDDLPLKAIRTAISELVKIKGVDELRFYMSGIPSECLLVQYVERMAEHHPSTTQQSGPAKTSDEGQVSAQLNLIFDRLHDKDTTQTALKELYDFTVAHPEVDLQPHLDHTSKVFQGYIARGLKRLQMSGGSAAQPEAQGGDEIQNYKQRLEALKAKTQQLNVEEPEVERRSAEPSPRAPVSQHTSALPAAPSSASSEASAADRLQMVKARLARMKEQS